MKVFLTSSIGGSVKENGKRLPAQNTFFHRIGLKERLDRFQGMVIAWSAGSMNCAEVVYAGPELEGEAIDPDYKRWLKGLGLTRINIMPHYQSLQGEWLDGLRLIEDITCGDSMGHEFIAMNDGTFILNEEGRETLYGEAYRIKDGEIKQICSHGESLVL